MLNVAPFKENDRSVMIGFMKAHPFAMLIGCADNIPVATQIPFLIDERDGKIVLVGHITRKQDHHLALDKNQEVLVVFTGPHSYVSASWYTDPHQASTWNYMSVHARGKIRFTDGEALEQALRRLSLHYEKENAHSPTVFDNLSVEYRQKLIKAIVSFEIEVVSLDGVFKLSQNRDKKSYDHIVEKLQAADNDARDIADEMTSRSSQLFNE